MEGGKYYGAAAEYNRPSGFQFDKRILMVVALGFVGLILISLGFSFVNSLNEAPRNEFASLLARQRNLVTFIEQSKGRVRSPELIKLNSDLTTFVSSDRKTLSGRMTAEFGTNVIPEKIVAGEADTTTAKILKDAEIINQYDSAYYRLLRDKIAATRALIERLSPNYGGATKTALEQAKSNLKIVDDQLAALKP